MPVETVTIVLGDTDIVSVGGGSHSGRSMRHAGTVMLQTAEELLEDARNKAATLFEAPPETVEFDDGHFAIPGTNQTISLVELAKVSEDGQLFAARTNEMHQPVFPNGAALCEMEIDPDTGVPTIARYFTIDDVGRCINPMIVHGQTHGGIAQGVGQAMWEHSYIDPQSGQPLCGSFMDYGMPRADALPDFETEIAEVLSPTNPLGIKAGGEGGTTPALAVIVNSVVDALRPYGVEDMSMPVTPHKIWQAIHGAKAKQGDTE